MGRSWGADGRATGHPPRTHRPADWFRAKATPFLPRPAWRWSHYAGCNAVPRLAPAGLRRHAIPPPRSRLPSRMARILAVIAPVLLLVPTARTQQIDTTLWARLRYRFVGPEGNRAVAVAGEPGNPLVAYVGAASGGIWKTEDGGVHWRAVFDSQPAQAIGAMALAPSAHNVLWAGTGETFFIRSTTALGDGVYRSTDAGRSWQHQGLDGTGRIARIDRKSTRLNSSHSQISYAVFCLKKKKNLIACSSLRYGCDSLVRLEHIILLYLL